MVTLPAGRYWMGSDPAETTQPGWPVRAGGNERPRHEVIITEPFAIGATEVTRAQFAAFVTDSGYTAAGGCMDMRSQAQVRLDPALSWRDPGFAQRDDEPVVCVSWDDASAYADWLAQRTGLSYRLPSEAEWEYAARAGTTSAYFWGDAESSACRYANTRTAPEHQRRRPGEPPAEPLFPCEDGAEGPSPVGRYSSNPFGLHDMLGNVFEWTADCNHPSYDGAPEDGRAWLDAEPCVFRVMRGGSASNGPRQNRAASRAGRPASGRAPNLGFRVARSLTTTPGTASPAAVAEPLPAAGTGPGADLFHAHCAGCHVDLRTFRGVYGTSLAAVERTIRDGGANTMSMPAWGEQLTGEQIRVLAAHVRKIAGWQ